MNFEHQDNILLADWTFSGSLLSSSAEIELRKIEELIDLASNLYEQGLIQAVLWIQKVPYSDFCTLWYEELKYSLLRDDLRWRLARIFLVRRAIQESPFPWLYLTESDCLGILAELMFACQRRFVFEMDTKFGFPELVIGQLPPAGWLSYQIERKPRLLELWNRQCIWKAEEAVQLGLLDAALSWKDWRLELFAWARRQIELWELEAPARKIRQTPWKPLEKLWSERATPPEMKSQIKAYTERTSRRLESQTGLDAELIDSVAHFMFQSPYESWLRRGLSDVQETVSTVLSEVVYFDITEALPPVSIIAKILDCGLKVVFFSDKPEILKKNLESTFVQLENRYRRHALQLFEKQITWYVGVRPRQPHFITFSFGYFRNITINYREWEVRGWVLTHQKMERQAIELGHSGLDREVLKIASRYFESIYYTKNFSFHMPLIYLIKSLALQQIIEYCRESGESLDIVFEQLRGIEWKLLGSLRHWERFLDYRNSLEVISQIATPERFGAFHFQKSLLNLVTLDQVRAACAANPPLSSVRGPGYLHNVMSAFAAKVANELVREGCLKDAQEAELYATDVLGYPAPWGSEDAYSRRMGVRMMAFASENLLR